MQCINIIYVEVYYSIWVRMRPCTHSNPPTVQTHVQVTLAKTFKKQVSRHLRDVKQMHLYVNSNNTYCLPKNHG